MTECYLYLLADINCETFGFERLIRVAERFYAETIEITIEILLHGFNMLLAGLGVLDLFVSTGPRFR
jgi:hypothetical protein